MNACQLLSTQSIQNIIYGTCKAVVANSISEESI